MLVKRPLGTLLAIASFIIAIGSDAAAQSELVTQGVYQFSPFVDEAKAGLERDRLRGSAGPRDGVIPFDAGALTSGGGHIGWRGSASAPGQVAVVFDLLADRRIKRVEIDAPAPNKFWKAQRIELDYRGANDGVYRAGGYQAWTPGGPIRFQLDTTARYVRIRLTRQHSYVNVPLSEVRIIAERERNLVLQPVPDSLSAEFERDTLLVDEFGQYLYETWPGKIQSEEDLRRDLHEEMRRLASIRVDADRFDAYGGDKRFGREEATGFFRLAKIRDRWWFVTPEGHRFFAIGVDGAAWHEWGYATPLNNPDGTPRRVFESLPDYERFGPAYKDHEGVRSISFVVANLMRKYGDDFPEHWSDVTAQRLRAWGFNTHAKWTRDPNIKLPYVTVLRPKGERRIKWAIDPFDPGLVPALEAGMRDRLIAMRDDPWILGHTFENERGWDDTVVAAMLAETGDSPAKRAFLEHVTATRGIDAATLGTIFHVEGATIDALMATPLKAPETLADGVASFIRLASERYHEAVRRVMKRYDPNHAFLGCSMVPGWRSSPEWIAGSVPYVDALSFDRYHGDPSWIEAYITHDRPILLLEFSFSVNARGLRAHSAASTANDHRERGLMYRYLIEQLAADPRFVGFGWFLFYDQPVTRRSLPGGENFNMGLVNQADQPYWPMVEEMAKTNARVLDIHAGTLKPVGREILAR
jgi:hypothetical protein